jgi:hypothetical protein
VASVCGVSFGICRLRVTLVDAQGVVSSVTDNSYVTDNAVSISLTPNIGTGNTFEARNGCGCSKARFKAKDLFNWWEFSFRSAELEPALMAMLMGANTIEDGADIVGMAFQGALACDEDEPAVALEFWTQHISGSGQDGTLPWIHWVFPKTVWQMGDNTFEEGFAEPTVNGFSRTNSMWGRGPYGDGPPDNQDISEGGWWYTADLPPAASCDVAHVVPSS